MNAGGWQPVIGWTTVAVSAVAAALHAFAAGDGEVKQRQRTRQQTALTVGTVLIIAGLFSYLLFDRGLPYIWLALGTITAGNFAADCRHSPIDRKKTASDLLFMLGFFALGWAELTNSTTLSAAAVLLMVFGWILLLLSSDSRRDSNDYSRRVAQKVDLNN
ncbi:MAG TPA: hypothetical protein VFH72_00860 [Candidatus Baltobacteraceae bacterium]|nr:hypothetical protein [Candidatus Baltobacteraceae bacterium]